MALKQIMAWCVGLALMGYGRSAPAESPSSHEAPSTPTPASAHFEKTNSDTGETITTLTAPPKKAGHFKPLPHPRPEGKKLYRVKRLALSLSLLYIGGLIGLIAWWRRHFHDDPFPLRGLSILVGLGALTAAVNALLLQHGLETGVPIRFPISEGLFSFAKGDWAAIAFVLVLSGVLLLHKWFDSKGWLLCLAAIALVVLGNLAQGSFADAFFHPFLRNGRQYCQDAATAGGSLDFLARYHDLQSTLSVHAKTHPPFAVLLHKWFIDLGDGRPLIMALAIASLACLSLLLAWRLFREAGAPENKAPWFALLLSVLPAFNIYAIASLDGVIAAATLLALIGLVRILRKGIDAIGFFLLLTGLVAVNALTFGGTFLIAAAGLAAMMDVIWRKRWDLIIALAGTGSVCVILWLTGRGMGYDHAQAFLRAAALENPEGFRGFQEPLKYIMTRAECLFEIVFFASLPVAAMLTSPRFWRIPPDAEESALTRLTFAGVAVLGLMFLSGAFRTGETARTCLFIYPFLLLLLRHAPTPVLRMATAAAGAQTILMQWLGDFFW